MNQLEEIIRHEIAEHGGCITFERFMEMALYHPELGYYSREQVPIGRVGDFYTSVSLGSLFGELLAFQFVEWIEEIRAATHDLLPGRSDRFQIVEAGAHDGRLGVDILKWIRQARSDLADQIEYWIVEPSPHRRSWQEEQLDCFAGRVRWFDSWPAIPERSVNGVIFANELIDAFPVHRIGWDAQKQSWFEWGVGLCGGEFGWARIPAAQTPFTKENGWPDLPAELLAVLPDSFTTELSPAAVSWWKQAAAALGNGKLLTLDYGLTEAKFFSPDRQFGTVRAYRQHRISSDILGHVGEQDLTAHVNFTALLRAGEQVGLITEQFCSQAEFLTQIVHKLWQRSLTHSWSPNQKRQFQTLTHPDHLGRAFQLLVQSRTR